MSLALSSSEQTSAEASMVAAFCLLTGTLSRLGFVPDGTGGESAEVESVGAVRFGVVKRDAQTITDGERTRTVVSATLKVALTGGPEVREKDIIEAADGGERWEVLGIVARQFLLHLSCRLVREG
jgi:hypothetical protein